MKRETRANRVDHLLFSFYRKSYAAVLGIDIHDDVVPWYEYSTLRDFVSATSGANGWRQVRRRLQSYGSRGAPKARLGPLLRWWPNAGTRHMRVLDVGCGTGRELNYLSRFYEGTKLIGVDNDASALETAARAEAAIEFHKSLTSATASQTAYDIAMCIHTLHHMAPRDQRSILRAIAEAVRLNGLLYVFEDSWSNAAPFRGLYHSLLSRQFLQLSTNAIRHLYAANDHWSNAWCYERSLPIAACAYQRLERWVALLPSFFKVVDSGVEGFNSDRLHGVPSGWVVARRIAR